MDQKYTFAKAIALEAGEIMKYYFFGGVDHKLKKDKTPVTIADETINDLVINKVKSSFPGHGVLGEERSFNKGASFLWVTDPIDGTIPFMLGIPTNVFSLALVVEGKPVIGVIYDPYLNKMYHAKEGFGSFVNDKKIKTSPKNDFDNSLVVVSARRALFKDRLFIEKLYDYKARIPQYYSATYSAVQVASGKFQAQIFSANTPWDVAAAKIIIEEAGGVTSDINGNPQYYSTEIKGFIAGGNKEIQSKLVELVSRSLN